MGKPQKPGQGQELHEAARSGDLSKVQSILISDPLAVNSRDKHSRTPYPSFSLFLLFSFVVLLYCVCFAGRSFFKHFFFPYSKRYVT